MYLGYDNNKLGSNFPQRESKGQTMKLKSILKNIHENTEDQVQISEEQKHAFLEHIKSFNVFGEAIYRSQNIIEALKEIKNIVETAHHLTLQETGDWFDKVTVNRHMKQLKESYKTFEKTANEMYTLQQRLEACYEDMGNTLNKYYNISEDGGANLQEKESDYQKTFSKVMKKAKIESPADLKSDKQKKQFFKQLDKSYKSKEEQK
jgi:predicted O-linked N-acetylglucosamine transferase (SPINDLY family)